jgi:hypothetical protein
MLSETIKSDLIDRKYQQIFELAQDELKSISPNVILNIESAITLPIFDESIYFFKVNIPNSNSYRYWIDWTEELGAWIEADGQRATITIKESRLINPEPIESSLITCLTSHIAATCLCLQGQIAIHANVIAINNKAIAFAGDSGKGKSTLTAYCASQGAGFITDDVLVLDDRYFTRSGSFRIKLFPSLAADLGLKITDESDYKIHFNPEQLGAKIQETPLPVKVLYILEESSNSTIYTETLSLGEAITHLIRHSYHSSVVIKDNPSLFDKYIDLAQKIKVKKLFYPRQLDRLGEVYCYLQKDN